MSITYSDHWFKKRKYRKDITDDMIEYAINNSNELRAQRKLSCLF